MPYSINAAQNFAELLELCPDPLWLLRHPARTIQSRLKSVVDMALQQQECVPIRLTNRKKADLERMRRTGNYRELPERVWFSHKNLWKRFDNCQRIGGLEMEFQGNYWADPRRLPFSRLGRFEGAVLPKAYDKILEARALFPEFCRIYKDLGNYIILTEERGIEAKPYILDFEWFQCAPEFYAEQFVEKIWGMYKLPEEENL